MELSVEDCENIGKGLKTKHFIPKGSCFFVEKCFSSSRPLYDQRIINVIENCIASNLTTAFVVILLIQFEKDKKKLDDFIKNHGRSGFKINQEIVTTLTYIAKLFDKDVKFLLYLYFCIEENAFANSFLISCKYFEQYLYDKASYANHQCIGFNTDWVIDPKSYEIRFIARRDIKIGEWITITYESDSAILPHEVREKLLRFQCACLDCIVKRDGNVNFFGLTFPSKKKNVLFGVNSKNLADILHKNKEKLQSNDKSWTLILFAELVEVFEKDVETHLPLKKAINWPQLKEDDLKMMERCFYKLIVNFDASNTCEARMVLIGSICLKFLGLESEENFTNIYKVLLGRQKYYGIDETKLFASIAHLIGF